MFFLRSYIIWMLLWSMLPPPRRPQTWIICLTIRPSFPWHPSMGMWARSAWRTTWHVNSPFGRWTQSSNFGNCNLHTRCFWTKRRPSSLPAAPKNTHRQDTTTYHQKGHKSKPKYSLLHPTPSFMDSSGLFSRLTVHCFTSGGLTSFGVGIPLDRLL